MDQSHDNHITFFGTTTFRDQPTRFGIKQKDRRAGICIIGRTGTGKTSLLETIIRQDLVNNQGLSLVDPHGDLATKIVASIPVHRKKDLIYFNVADSKQALGFNPLESIHPSLRPLAASGLISAFKKIWLDSWGPRLEHILRHCFLTLLEQPSATLLDIPLLLNDQAFRSKALAHVSNTQLKQFWLTEYAKYPERMKAEAIAPIQNKVGAFLANPILRTIISHPKSSFKLGQIMDEGKVLVVNLSKGQIGEDTASLLGALLTSRIELAALHRGTLPEKQRRDFHVTLDEFSTITNASIATMLSELRKYRVNLILATQYLSQLEPEVRESILGNIGTLITFRIGVTDAETLAPEFAPDITPTDLVSLPNYHLYLKLMIDGAISTPFSAHTLPPATNATVTQVSRAAA
jgi:GTPase SAR1 family protein